jgi:ubiquinone/menaquinone biosynthesis C-methylase UbiE
MRARSIRRRTYDWLQERVERLTGRADPLVPPGRLMFVGGTRSDFRAMGDKWVQTFIRLAGLKPSESVLDVGCGVGRMAASLSRYLNADARYEGFDIVREGIDWCQEHITPRFPRFRFQHADLYNKGYNPGGTLRAADFRFPYDGSTFDLVILTSVFTHMLPADVKWYLSEIRRVLRPGGRCLMTFFVLDASARQLIAGGAVDPSRRFAHDMGGYWVMDREVPEATLAYAEEAVREMVRDAGLVIQEPIHLGGWGGKARARSNHSQDIVVATVA